MDDREGKGVRSEADRVRTERLQAAERSEQGHLLAKRRDEVVEEARRAYGVATHDKFMEYHKAWTPLRQAWEEYQRPFFEDMILAEARANDKYCLALGKLVGEMFKDEGGKE